ncbi:MAG: methylmalonyl-CoA mutase family protein [Syntrophales bacterium LBB04]|nr:methylmalonyl-CoA mutase family protein [Syntrophales bacterium LBB04]
MAAKNETKKRIAQEKQRWLEKFKIDKSPTIKTDFDATVDAVYTPADIADTNYLDDIGFPGMYPFTRGPYPEMSRHRPWRYALFTGFDTPEKTNERWKFLYKAGQPSFNIVYDLPTHLGKDSDDPHAEDEVGRLGIPICTIRDWDALWKDLPMEGLVQFNSNIETLAAVIIAFHVATAEKRGITPEKIWGSCSNDPLSTAVSKGTTVFALESGVRLATDLIEYSTRNMPRFFPVNLKAVNMAEGGASMIQEMAFVFSNAICLIDETLKRGLSIDDFAGKFSFFGCSTTHLLQETAKWRASRRLWAKLMKEKYGAKKDSTMAFKFTGFHNPLWLYPEEPELNLVRAAMGALASALGGAQAMPHPGFDEAYAIPTEKSQSLALGTQQILAEETDITKAVDPLGGSYYIEWLTNRIEEELVHKMKEVELQGGAIAAIKNGFMQREIQEYFYSQQQAIESGERVVVRKNKYRIEGEEEDVEARIVLHQVDTEAVKAHIYRLKQVKAERDNVLVKQCLAKLKEKAKGTDNVMPALVEAAKAYASIGEITNALKEVWGGYKETITF